MVTKFIASLTLYCLTFILQCGLQGADNGLVMLDDLYEDEFSLPLSPCQSNSICLTVIPSVFRHIIQKQVLHFHNRPPGSPIDTFLTLDLNQKRLMSVLYSQICSLSPDPVVPLKELWESVLGSSISGDQWSDILNLVHISSVCARHGAHFTNGKLSDAWNTCGHSIAVHLHISFSTKIDPNTMTALFGLPRPGNMPIMARRIIAFTTLLAELCPLQMNTLFPSNA